MAADVSVEALEKAKETAKKFEDNVANVSADIVEQNETTLEECRNAIRDTEKDLMEVISKIQDLERQIAEKTAQISSAKSEVANLKQQVEISSNRLSGVESRISMLENRKSQLQAQLSRAEDDDARRQIQQSINEIQSEISSARSEAAELRRKITEAKQRINELQALVERLEAEKAKLEQERDREKIRKAKIEDKLERMKRVFSSLNADMNEYTASVKKFEKKSTTKVDANVTAIDKCITAIESYLAVNLAGGFVASSMVGGGTSGGGSSSNGDSFGGINNVVSTQSVGLNGGANNNVSSSQTNTSGIGMMMATCMGTLAAMGIPNCSWVRNAVATFLTSQSGGNSSGSNGTSSGGNISSSGNSTNSTQVTSTCEQVANSFIEHCITSTNPNYSNGEEWQNNCYLCVPAYEANRRGGNVVARSATSNERYLDASAMHLRYHPFDVWQNPDVINISPTDSQGNEVSPIREISRQMRQWGEGSRAEVAVYWNQEGHSGGHVFIAEFRNNSIHFSDPQTGETDTLDWFADFEGFATHGGLLTDVSFCRIDGLQFNSRYLNRCYTEDGR